MTVASCTPVLREMSGRHGLDQRMLDSAMMIAVMKAHAWTWKPGDGGVSGERVRGELVAMLDLLDLRDPELPEEDMVRFRDRISADRDRLLSQMEALAAHRVLPGFVPTAAETAAAAKWTEAHYRDEHPGFVPAGVPVPARFAWVFLPTSMGVIASVQCQACGKEEVVSDFSDW